MYFLGGLNRAESSVETQLEVDIVTHLYMRVCKKLQHVPPPTSSRDPS